MLGQRVATPVFDGASQAQVQAWLVAAGLPPDGKVDLYDGRTGERFARPVTIGVQYLLKLHHLIEYQGVV